MEANLVTQKRLVKVWRIRLHARRENTAILDPEDIEADVEAVVVFSDDMQSASLFQVSAEDIAKIEDIARQFENKQLGLDVEGKRVRLTGWTNQPPTK